ncbi:MAG: tRNA (guanosine(46)-N7)-methyltransferase TrmB [Gammaproteobacteria bacterium]|nr:tRNA (guanosine(46)-N7)-methyltransferase TrmB [Gammaproteobacteria bacterium]
MGSNSSSHETNTRRQFNRKIRSFVRRESRMSKRQRHAYETLMPTFGIDATGPVINLDSLFGRTGITVLEIGFGMGDSLVQMARDQPDVNYVGIEIHRPGIGSVLANINEHTIHNIRLFCADAVDVLPNRIPLQSLDRIQVFFPDPWQKQRHHKRRLIQAPFVQLLADRLKPQGILHIATDWQHYADHIDATISASPAFCTAGDHIKSARPSTKFENRGLRLGHDVRDLLFQKM